MTAIEQQQLEDYLAGGEPDFGGNQFQPVESPAWTSTARGMADANDLFRARAAQVGATVPAPFVDYQSKWTPTPNGGLEGQGNYSEYLKQFADAGQDTSPARWLKAMDDYGKTLHGQAAEQQAKIDRESVFKDPKLAASILEAEAKAKGVQQAASQRGDATVKAAEVRANSQQQKTFRPTHHTLPDGSWAVSEIDSNGKAGYRILLDAKDIPNKILFNTTSKKIIDAEIELATVEKQLAMPGLMPVEIKALNQRKVGAEGALVFLNKQMQGFGTNAPTMGGGSTNLFSPTATGTNEVANVGFTPKQGTNTYKIGGIYKTKNGNIQYLGGNSDDPRSWQGVGTQ